MKKLKVVKDSEAFRLLADETRRKIVQILRLKEMNVSQLASDLNLTPQAVYHHVKKLVKGGLIEVTREERCGHLIESYYRATAELFSFSYGKASAAGARSRELAKEEITNVLKALKKVGFNLEYDEAQISQLVDARIKQEKCCKNVDELIESIYEMDDLDLFAKETAVSFAKNLAMSEKEFSNDHEKRKNFRKLLISLTKK
ncbi:MAG: helix-turn-helix domain-containing protein [Candidatus Bathyarchaeota archaeon]|nr:MAG: helix-turn-helix domain-containing protein [Candidatus Bathyarchaeota archaeon]